MGSRGWEAVQPEQNLDLGAYWDADGALYETEVRLVKEEENGTYTWALMGASMTHDSEELRDLRLCETMGPEVIKGLEVGVRLGTQEVEWHGILSRVVLQPR